MTRRRMYVKQENDEGGRGLDDAPSNPSKLNGPISTLCHRQSSVAIGGELPMTTGSATRLPIYCS